MNAKAVTAIVLVLLVAGAGIYMWRADEHVHTEAGPVEQAVTTIMEVPSETAARLRRRRIWQSSGAAGERKMNRSIALMVPLVNRVMLVNCRAARLDSPHDRRP